MIKIPKKVKDRLTKEVPPFKKILEEAKTRDINESDTVTIVTDMLHRVFGFDKYAEVTSEQAIKGTFCDLAVKLDESTKYLIEVKAIGLDLTENHLRQALNYGANHGIPWIVLTNGVDWQIYKVRFEQPIDLDHLCSFVFTELNPRRQEDLSQLYLLCRDGIKKQAIEEFHEHVQSVNRFIIGAIAATAPVVEIIRRELRRIAPDIKVSKEEIESLLLTEVLKRDVVEGETAAKAKMRVKRAAGKMLRKRGKASSKQTRTISQSADSESTGA